MLDSIYLVTTKTLDKIRQ